MQTPMQEFEKLPDHSLMVTGTAGLTHSRLLYIADSVSNYCFLIDTGTEVSVLPPSSTERQQRCNDFSLVAVNGANITYYLWKMFLNIEPWI